jgi:hypothetical protein
MGVILIKLVNFGFKVGFGVLWREDENFKLLKCITE